MGDISMMEFVEIEELESFYQFISEESIRTWQEALEAEWEAEDEQEY